MDKIIAVLRANQDKAPDELVNDFQNLPVNQQTNEYDRDASAAFIKKWAPYIQANFENWEEIDYSANEPLKTRMAKDGVNPDLIGNTNYLVGLARKYGSTPEEVSKAFAEIVKEKEVADEKQKLAEEYKREAESKYARQKAVDDYQHSYLGMDLDNPLNKGMNWLADLVISDKTKKAVVEDPNATGRALANVGVDVVGTGADFLPGIGGIVVGPALRTGRDIAEGDKATDALKRGGIDIGLNFAFAKAGKYAGSKAGTETLKGTTKEATEAGVKNIDEAIKTMNPEKIRTASGIKIDPSTIKNKTDLAKMVAEHPELESLYKKYTATSDRLKSSEVAKKILDEYELTRLATNKGISYDKALNKAYKAKYVQEHPVMSKVGEVLGSPAGQKILDVGKQVVTGIGKSIKRTPIYEGTTEKPKNPSKIKTHSDAIDFIIDNNKRQWEAGFKPHDMNSIVGEAYKKWESER